VLGQARATPEALGRTLRIVNQERYRFPPEHAPSPGWQPELKAHLDHLVRGKPQCGAVSDLWPWPIDSELTRPATASALPPERCTKAPE
jgi:hypothetical protein